jgi:hypothetical protein
MSYREKTPQVISILTRKLKPGKTFQDFQKAHIPPGEATKTQFGYDSDYFPIPTRVINCISAEDPTIIISIGLSYGDPQVIFTAAKEKLNTEQKRHDAIAEVADKIGAAKVYFVGSDNNYGGKDPSYTQEPLPEITPEILAMIQSVIPQKTPGSSI